MGLTTVQRDCAACDFIDISQMEKLFNCLVVGSVKLAFDDWFVAVVRRLYGLPDYQAMCFCGLFNFSFSPVRDSLSILAIMSSCQETRSLYLSSSSLIIMKIP